jgi:hypothetical protein
MALKLSQLIERKAINDEYDVWLRNSQMRTSGSFYQLSQLLQQSYENEQPAKLKLKAGIAGRRDSSPGKAFIISAKKQSTSATVNISLAAK